MTRRLILFLLLLVALGIGLFQAIDTLRSVKPNQSRLERKQRQLASLQALAPKPGLGEVLAQANLPRPDRMSELTAVYLPDHRVKVKDLKPETVETSWQRLQSVVEISALPGEALSHFIKKVENQPNPWRLIAYEMKPAGENLLSGQLTFQCFRAEP